MSKTLTSKLHMKQRLYAHRLEEGVVHEHLTVFKEILSNLEAMEVQYDKKDLGLILLCSLPLYYSTFRDMILYSCEFLTVDEVYDFITSYDKERVSLFMEDKIRMLIMIVEGHRNRIFAVNLKVDRSLQIEEKLVTSARRKGICLMLEVELWGAFEGVKLALEKGVKNIVLELNSIEAVNLLSGHT
ncbi:hypothetical protein J1N35_035513 [Gossypium stocksii]|uniref:RNase H type-1 domain-containing protein n=1 Tax=Gossypium stocksii TaxID=47602 RepID=A0A9D3UU64_9ROSI|nr:hypothetical protein J1N35_035513 [Gossypium stocksii]